MEGVHGKPRGRGDRGICCLASCKPEAIKYIENTFVTIVITRYLPSLFLLLIIVVKVYFIIFLSFVPQFVASLVMLAWIFVLVAGYRVAINMVDAME